MPTQTFPSPETTAAEARALQQLRDRVAAHTSGKQRFSVDDARAMFATFTTELGTDALTATFQAEKGRAARDPVGGYPVRQFGGQIVSFNPNCDSHRTGRSPRYV